MTEMTEQSLGAMSVFSIVFAGEMSRIFCQDMADFRFSEVDVTPGERWPKTETTIHVSRSVRAKARSLT